LWACGKGIPPVSRWNSIGSKQIYTLWYIVYIIVYWFYCFRHMCFPFYMRWQLGLKQNTFRHREPENPEKDGKIHLWQEHHLPNLINPPVN
jgi:hypothetical protein